MTISFQKAVADDTPYLLNLRISTMDEHLKSSGLNLTEQDHLARVNEAFERCKLIYLNDTRVGMVKYQIHTDSLHINQIQIDPAHQNKGIGGAVLRQLTELAGPRDCTLNVLKTNPAYALYQRLGFAVTGEDNFEFHMRRAASRSVRLPQDKRA